MSFCETGVKNGKSPRKGSEKLVVTFYLQKRSPKRNSKSQRNAMKRSFTVIKWPLRKPRTIISRQRPSSPDSMYNTGIKIKYHISLIRQTTKENRHGCLQNYIILIENRNVFWFGIEWSEHNRPKIALHNIKTNNAVDRRQSSNVMLLI
jgi:hypothetical protein